MIYPILLHGSDALRQPTETVAADYPELKKLVQDLFDTMYAADGVGLAAPQVGKSIRLFVVDASPFDEDEPELADFQRVFINPEIYERSADSVLFNEGCLSYPGIHEDVQRPSSIRIRYHDENFVPRDEAVSGTAARIIQHEYDHLESKVFIDLLSPLRKRLLQSKLNGLIKGKHKASYKCKSAK